MFKHSLLEKAKTVPYSNYNLSVLPVLEHFHVKKYISIISKHVKSKRSEQFAKSFMYRRNKTGSYRFLYIAKYIAGLSIKTTNFKK